MEERRKSKRLELSSKLLIKRLDSEDGSREVDIDVMDVSKTGVGFLCGEALEIGAVYEAALTIWTKEVVHAFLEIVRIERTGENQFSYGAIFIGMSEIEASRIATYSTIESLEN
ncbi:MAG: PilZ domain-containing protein [Lachnospiraceae bacterium]|nr:PilZ domain-containing protein [Lachnospiraceae bacterium]